LQPMLNVSNLGVNFQGTDLFQGITFLVNKKDRIGLVGKNGAGKSTILKIIAGVQVPSEGQVDLQGEIEVGYLPQEFNYNSDRSVLDETKMAFEKVILTEQRIEAISLEIGTREDYESEAYQELIEELNHLYEVLNHLDADKSDSKIERVLKGLGFAEKDFGRPLREFSGGWQMRVELAKLILAKPEVLLLDEPTNHLDIESILWLETFFNEYDGALIMISHDRMFLDNVTNRTIEIVHGRIYDYKVAYSKFLTLREERVQQQESAFKNQQSYIKQQEKFIERFRAKAAKAKQVQSKIKQLDKIERVQFDDVDGSEIAFRFPTPPRSGELVTEAQDLDKSYGDHQVLKNLNFKILRGERVAFVGKNGMGKSTLIKLLVGEEEGEGMVRLGHNVELGYYAQVQENTLNPKRSVLQTLEDVATGDWSKGHRLRALLGSFLFRDEDMDKKVSVLSGGEKSRLALSRMLLKDNNLLILDEPTNHLDLASKDVLKKALMDYEGTLILVSHDRSFLQDLTERTFEFKDGKIKEHSGDINDFLAHHHVDNFRAFELDPTAKVVKTTKKTEKVSENKEDYANRKERTKKLRSLQKEVQKLERRMEQMEEELKQLELKMADPEVHANEPELSKKLFFEHADLKLRIEQKLGSWEKLSEEKEELEAQE